MDIVTALGDCAQIAFILFLIVSPFLHIGE
jgi:hypothetical protein